MIETLAPSQYPSVRNIAWAILLLQPKEESISTDLRNEIGKLKEWFKPYICQALSLSIESDWEEVFIELGLSSSNKNKIDAEQFMLLFRRSSGIYIEEWGAIDRYRRMDKLVEDLVGKM